MSAPPDCLFCRVVARDAYASIVAETELSLAFRDLHPQAPTHVLIVPKRHVVNVGELTAYPEEVADVFALAVRVAGDEGLGKGYRLVTNTGRDGGQTVYHAHIHVLGGRAMTWPPG